MKDKKISPKNLPTRLSLLEPFVFYMICDYFNFESWVFPVYMTLWVLCLVMKLVEFFKTESVDIFEEKIK